MANDTAKRDPEATLKLVGGMRRESYAVGVFCLALGLGAANTVTQVNAFLRIRRSHSFYQ